jgi:hypothetical protein
MEAKPEHQQVIIFPRGQLTAGDRQRLRNAGLVAVEADDPKAVVQVIQGAATVGADDMLMSAMHALCGDMGSGERSRFVLELYRRMKAREFAAIARAPGQ